MNVASEDIAPLDGGTPDRAGTARAAAVPAPDRLLVAIVESSDDAIVSKTLEGFITSWNGGAERLFGWTADEMIGQSILRIIPPEIRHEEDLILQRVRAGERLSHYETERVTKDGRRFPVSLTVSPVRDRMGVIVGASKIARDVSERRRMEEALRSADRRKDEFLAMLSHELRNPLAPIRNAARLLQQPSVGPAQVRWCGEVIARQASQLAALLDDLLSVARITQGVLELDLQPVRLGPVLATAVESVEPMLAESGHRFDLELPAEDVELRADPVRLAQVVANLLTNAAKYTPPGGHVVLTAARRGADARLSVRDDGIGMSAELLPRVFDLFARGADPWTTGTSGLGVGLALVRRVVEMHGGHISAHSAGPGCGSEFVVVIPLAGPRAAVDAPGDSGHVAGP